MSTKTGLKKTFSWRFGPSKFSRKNKTHSETEVDEPDSRRHTNAFPFHSQPSSVTELDRESNAESSSSGPNSSVGFISDILDGVVFTPIGASELPRPSPDTRSRSSLSSFRPPEAEEESTNPTTVTTTTSTNKQLESIKAIRTKSPPPTDLETLFQRELAAKIKKRCLENQQRQLEAASGVTNPPLSRSVQSALPPIPKLIADPIATTEPTSPNGSTGEFENPLYQTLDECYSGTATPPPPPPLPTDHYDEITYAVIDENDSSHYQTVVSGILVTEQGEEEEEERVYAQVADDLIGEQIYDTAKSPTETASETGDAIYENLEELQEQTYANILSPPDCSHLTRSSNVLTALVLDVDAAVAASSSSASRSSNSSSSGNSSSSPQQSTSSPEQLSPTDSLANVSVGSVRSIHSPDSGVFGLLKPADFLVKSETLVIKVKTDSPPNNQSDLLDRTLKEFERLEQLSTFEYLPKQSSKMNEFGVLLTPTEEKVSGSGTTEEPVLLQVTNGDNKTVPISEIPIERLLDLAGSVEPSDVNSAQSDSDDGGAEPPSMPMSPPPSEIFRNLDDDGLFQASLVSVDSQGSSMTTSSLNSGLKETNDTSDTESMSTIPTVRTPEPKMNLGAKIVEDQVKRMQELEHARNQRLGLEDVGESFDKLSSSRLDVIDQMKPKTVKRKEWLSPAKDNNTDQEELTSFIAQPLDGKQRSGGVNSESILVKKEETKAFWEGKMQSETEDPVPLTNGRNHRIKMDKSIQRQQTALSPPPGFDNDFNDENPIEESDVNEEDEPSLSNTEFIDVASITFKSDSNSDTKPFVIFGTFEDSHIDAIESDQFGAVSALTVPSVPVQVEKPQRNHDIRPKPLYFEPDRASSSSDNELEPESPRSFSGGKGISFVNSHPNPTETLIEREIRLQREREEAVLRERQKALEILEATRKQTKIPEAAPRKSLMAESNKKEVHKPTVAVASAPLTQQSADFVATVKKAPVETKKATEVLVSPAEIRISEEIRELKRREEELRQLREANARNNTQNGSEDPSSFTASGVTDDEGLYSDAERDVSSSEANSSRVESPEAGIMPNDYSKFPHQRTQSMDSMSSGHSSGDHVLAPISSATEAIKRGRTNKTVVMPLEDLSDQDETPAYLSRSKETPIEREIRLGREREEALRREKGLQPLGAMTVSASRQNEKEGRQGQRLVNGGGDNRDVQHRYATSIIQREMNEIAERENELVRDGKIQTTSIERADSKVSSLGDYSKKKAVSAGPVKSVTVVHSHQTVELAPQQRSESVNEGRESPSETNNNNTNNKKPPQMRVTYANRGYGNATTALGSMAAPAASTTWRNFSNPQGGQRGLMEKFFMSRGRLNSPATFNSPTSSTASTSSSSVNHSVVTPGSSAGDPVGVNNHSKAAPVRYLPPAVKPVELQTVRRDEEDDQVREKVVPPRRHHATTEEKIQQEFREMQKREEELKLNRSKFFAKSQPNLLDIDEGISEPEQRLGGQLRSAHSISDLLADESQPTEMREDLPPMSSSSTVKGARRKSALIAQWENRIHQQDF